MHFDHLCFFNDGESTHTNVLYHAAWTKGERIRFSPLTGGDVSITVVMVLVCNTRVFWHSSEPSVLLFDPSPAGNEILSFNDLDKVCSSSRVILEHLVVLVFSKLKAILPNSSKIT